MLYPTKQLTLTDEMGLEPTILRILLMLAVCALVVDRLVIETRFTACKAVVLPLNYQPISYILIIS